MGDALIDAIPYVPLVTTVLAVAFGTVILRRRRALVAADGQPRMHLLWWGIGVYFFGLGTIVEGLTAVFGWSEFGFRAWYISGALLGGAPLAQGTVYLLVGRRISNTLAVILVAYVTVAAVFVILSPLTPPVADERVLNGEVLDWQWVRLFSPFVNTYAFLFLVGGAIYSAFAFRGQGHRSQGNALIAFGAILPGIGGSFSRAGYTEVLYIGEFIGIIFIYFGYRLAIGQSLFGDGATRAPTEAPALTADTPPA